MTCPGDLTIYCVQQHPPRLSTKRTPAGFLLPMKFTKPAIDLDAQITLLKQRGLVVADDEVARHYLRFVGYYRLAGYALPLQPPVHRLVTAWARDIARHRLHKNRLADDGKDPISRAWRDALRLLQQVAEGKFAIGPVDTVAVHKTQAIFDSAPLVFGRKQLRAWR